MKKIVFILTLALFFSCSKSYNSNLIVPNNENIWTIDTSFLSEGVPFPLMDSPKFKKANELPNIPDSSKVLLVSINNKVRAYPYVFTNYYEIVNDNFDGNSIAISFCPLTKSGICFSTDKENDNYTFLASGFLFKENMVPIIIGTDNYISQMLMSIIKGNKPNKDIPLVNSIETIWKTVKDSYSNAEVFYHDNVALTSNGTVADNENFKNFYFGVLDTKFETKVKLYQYKEDTKLINTIINNKNTIIYYNKLKRIYCSYYIGNLTFSLLTNASFPNILKDNEGNVWDIFGKAVSGPREGERLEYPKSFVAGYWAWEDFYENLNIID